MSDLDILKYTESLVEDQDLSDEDAKLILEAARKRSEENPLTKKEIEEIERVVYKRTSTVSYDKLPKPIKVLAIFLIVAGIAQILSLVFMGFSTIGTGIIKDALAQLTTTSGIVAIISALCNVVSIVMSVAIGYRLLKGMRGRASELILVSIVFNVLSSVCEFMLYGIDIQLLDNVLQIIVQIAVTAYLNPSLVRERQLAAGLRRLDTETHAKSGTLGLADPGEGFIRLDFFNIFWCFVVCCVLGLIVEIIWHMAVVEPGVYQDRAGLLFGPFSPIYGIGAVLMTISLNRFKERNVLFLFVVCTIIGGGFEFFTSVFMEVAFGAKAWDYSHMPTGVLFGGRTCLAFASMFGLLGITWVKLLLPGLLKFINLIPWKMRYGVTVVCALLMTVNICMTLQSLDNWSARVNGHVPSTPVEQFYAEHFDNQVMADRFQSMTITPGASSRQ